MSELTADSVFSAPIIFGVTEDGITELRQQFSGLDSAETPQEYKNVSAAISTCVKLRSQVEKRRKELKQESLDYGRRVDSTAKRIVAAIGSVEDPLRTLKLDVDNAKKKEAERIEQERREAEEAEARAEREAEQARIAKERAELEAERKLMEAERAKLEEESRKAQAERDAIQAEKDRIEREKREAAIKAQAEKDAAERAERERIAAEERRAAEEKSAKERAEREAAEEKLRAEQAELAKSDKVKILELAQAIQGIELPQVKSEKAKRSISTVKEELNQISANIQAAWK